MHIPDGFLTAPVWGGLGAVSVPAVAVAARRARTTLDESRVPLMGVLGAFVFAAQMINFPVGIGASGHLVGGALLAITLGPAAAAVVLTAILAVQALVFQDGGLLALGANVFNMALAGVLAAWWPYRALARTRYRALGIFLAGFLSVFVTAMLCLGQLALSGNVLGAGPLGIALVVFAVTAALEGFITVAVLAALERINPRWIEAPSSAARPALALLLALTLLLGSAGFLVASSLPDGLERLAGMIGLDEREFALFKAPFPDYEALALSNPWLRKAAAALSGLVLTAAACLLLGRWIARLRSA